MQPAPLTGTATPHRGRWYSGCPGRCSLHPSRGRLLPGQWNTGRIRSGPRRKRPYRHPYDTPPCKGAAASFPDQICPQAVRVGRSECLRSKDTFQVYALPLVPRPGCRRTAVAVRRFLPREGMSVRAGGKISGCAVPPAACRGCGRGSSSIRPKSCSTYGSPPFSVSGGPDGQVPAAPYSALYRRIIRRRRLRFWVATPSTAACSRWGSRAQWPKDSVCRLSSSRLQSS